MKSRQRSNLWILSIFGILILTFGMTSPVLAETPAWTIDKAPDAGFAQGDVNKTYTITVTNSGGADTSGLITVTDTIPTGLIAQTISSLDPAWTCPTGDISGLTELICTRTAVMNSFTNSIITVTVDVAVDAGTVGTESTVGGFLFRTVNNPVTVSGGGSLDPATDLEVTPILQKPDLRILGYELLNEDKNAVLSSPQPDTPFWIRMTIENRGGDDTGSFYPGVFLDDKPNYGVDHTDAPLVFGEVTDFSDYRISPANTLNYSKGCLYYDPAGTIDPLTDPIIPERGNYTLSSFIPNLQSKTSMSVDVHIAYPDTEPDYVDSQWDGVRNGLSTGVYKIYLYVDPNCSAGQEESYEDNNVYPPKEQGAITLNVGIQSTTVSVKVEGSVKGQYNLNTNESKRVNYVGVDGGPVVVESANEVNLISALRDAYFVGGQLESFVQLMGLPKESLSTKYYFPAYNNVTLDGQLRFGNVGVSPTIVTVTIAGVVRGTYPLDPGKATRVNYAGLDSGPVVVESSGGVPIIAALRDAYYVDGRLESFAQLMGLPQEKLSTKYYFPAYNNVTLDGQLRIGNVGNSATTVTVTIAGVVRGTYPLNPSQAVRVNYAGLDSGPVVVSSSGGVPIIAALRDAYFVSGKLVSFVQLMGLPKEQLSTNYNFPAYNNVTLDGQLRFGNVGSSTTTVTIIIGGVLRGTYPLSPSQALRVNYAGLDSGPVVVQSSGGVPIIAALRDAYFVNGLLESFAQLMGLPLEQISSAYYFPAYNNVTLDGQLRFGVP